MNQNLALVVIVAVAAVVVLGIVIGRRLTGGRLKVGKIFSGEVKGEKAGPIVAKATAFGEQNKIIADGAGARVEDVAAIGKGNQISAGTGASNKSNKPNR
jgi:hypothetical protein